MTLVEKRDSGEGRFPKGQSNNTYLFERNNETGS